MEVAKLILDYVRAVVWPLLSCSYRFCFEAK